MLLSSLLLLYILHLLQLQVLQGPWNYYLCCTPVHRAVSVFLAILVPADVRNRRGNETGCSETMDYLRIFDTPGSLRCND